MKLMEIHKNMNIPKKGNKNTYHVYDKFQRNKWIKIVSKITNIVKRNLTMKFSI